MDGTIGLAYMQQRYYDPMIPRFLSVDPVTTYDDPVGQFHRYRYANNNPYSFNDADGRLAVPGFVVGVVLEVARQAVTGEIKDTSFKGVAKNVGKALIAGGAGAAGGGIATGVAKLTASMAARSVANGLAGAAIGASSRVATNAVEGQSLGDGVGMSALTGGVAGAGGSAVGDLIEGPVAQRLANSTGNFIGTPVGEVAAPAIASAVVSDAAAASTVLSNSPGIVDAGVRSAAGAFKSLMPPGPEEEE